jgi:hypothetical protein
METAMLLWRCLIGAPDPFLEAARTQVESDAQRIAMLR